MSYCLNPICQKPENPDAANFCVNCGSRLVLKDLYKAIEPIGQGGFGRTFRAVDLGRFGQPCVIKQFFPPAQNNPAALQKSIELFNREAEQLNELGKHPQIPELIAYFEQDASLYLVQELIEGQNLAEELEEQGAFSEQKIRELLLDLLPAIQFIHNRQVIHRDLKPENIIRRRVDRRLFLVDFGAAKVVTSKRDFAKTGTVIGSAEYTAPEQTRGKAVFKSDIYSLGVTCIHLLTNISPFELYDDVHDVWIWQQHLPMPVSGSIARIIDRMLARAIVSRFDSSIDILKALDRRGTIASAAQAGDIQISLSTQTVDYTYLRDRLALGDWQAADRETNTLILKLAGRSKKKELTATDIKKVSCDDLDTIDRLWMNYSKGRFGFSVQRTIWESMGGLLYYDAESYWRFADTYLKFANRVGWRTRKSWLTKWEWIKYGDFDFSLQAAQGHLPGICYWDGFGIMDSLFYRLKSCHDSYD